MTVNQYCKNVLVNSNSIKSKGEKVFFFVFWLLMVLTRFTYYLVLSIIVWLLFSNQWLYNNLPHRIMKLICLAKCMEKIIKIIWNLITMVGICYALNSRNKTEDILFLFTHNVLTVLVSEKKGFKILLWL